MSDLLSGPMRKRILIRLAFLALTAAICYFLAATVLTAAPPSALWKAVTGPTAQEKRVKVYKVKSGYQNGTTDIRVLLPERMEKGRRYKVLYILPTVPHGMDFWWNSGILEAVKYDVHNKYGLICVYPTFEKMPWYGDHPQDPRIRQESFLVEFVVPFIDKNFPTVKDPSGRLLLGISKSGCGAFTVLLRHPDVFGRAVSWDAPLLYDDITAVKAAGTEAVFGTKENFGQYYLPNLLKQKAALFRGQPARLVLMGHGFCRDQVEKAHQLMETLKIPHVYDNRTKRVHQWQSGWFPDAVRYLLEPSGKDRLPPR